MLSKLLQFVKDYQGDIILLIGVILISLLSFAAGYIAAKQQNKEPIKFEEINNPNAIQITSECNECYNLNNLRDISLFGAFG